MMLGRPEIVGDGQLLIEMMFMKEEYEITISRFHKYKADFN